MLAALFFSIGFRQTELFGRHLVVPVLTTHSIASQALVHMTHDLVPPEVHLIATDPFSTIGLELWFSTLLAFCAMLPFILIAVLRYLSPALYRNERNALFMLVLPALLLFATGAAFSYNLVIPRMFSFLYGFVPAMGAESLYSLSDFFSNVLSILVASGFMFELPVCMVLLTYMHIVRASFWHAHWRGAVLTFLIVTAIFSHDPSGVSMLMLSIPLTIFYFFAMVLCFRIEKNRA